MTPAPEGITIQLSENRHPCVFYFDEVYDRHSIAWVEVLQDTFNEQLQGCRWVVDDP